MLGACLAGHETDTAANVCAPEFNQQLSISAKGRDREFER
jgi:hypothetical protein